MTGEAFRHAQPAPAVGHADAHGESEPISPALRLQILSTEHWSLLATRSMTWNEAFSRSSIFLSVLSGATVALALVAQAMSFGDEFIVFALVILPVVLFIGLTTYLRLLESNSEDIVWVAGMNRLRNAYLELAPDLEPYFMTGFHDDARGIELSFGMQRPANPIVHTFVTMPGTIAVVDATLAGVIVGLIAVRLGFGLGMAIALAAVALLAVVALLGVLQGRSMIGLGNEGLTRFPSPPDRPGGAPAP